MTIANWEDARARARRRLPKIFFDYIDGAAFAEDTARRNVEDFGRWRLNQRGGVDVTKRDLSATYLGVKRALPFMLGPVGFCGLFAPNGEILAARAAHAAGTPYCLSNFGIISLQRLRAATTGPLWFQLYVMTDRKLTELFIQRAVEADCEAMAVTIDTSVGGVRDRDVRNGWRNTTKLTPRMALGMAMKPAWCLGQLRNGYPRIENLDGHPEFGRYALEQAAKTEIDSALTWDDLKRIRDRWTKKLIVKGVLHPADAERCVGIGADALVVSNHGGRQLDGAPSTISVLPEIVAAAGARLDVLFDGGVRRGAHVVTALALGAKGVLLGRAYAYALAAGGGAGVARMIDLLRTEVDVTIGHMGVTAIDQLHPRRAELLRPTL